MPVYLIAGPPCSGKSTLARKLAQPEAIVVDFDDICREIDGRGGWDHDYRTQQQAERLMADRIDALHGHQGDVYVIRCLPDPNKRRALSGHLGATVWMLNPGKAECIRRARRDRRPRSTLSGIDYWYRTYRPAACDLRPPALV